MRMIANSKQDCFWRHGTPSEQHYPCYDGKSTVCPRCCVEECPMETPDWFAACAAAGHPTWPSTVHRVPKKLVCMESSWGERVFDNTSVRGFFDALQPLISPPLQVAYRFIESAKHLAHYARKPDGLLWTDPSAWDAPIFYLAFHGSPGSVVSSLESLGADVLCDAFTDFGVYDSLIYFGACSVLRGAAGQEFGKQLLQSSGSKAVNRIYHRHRLDGQPGCGSPVLVPLLHPR